MTYEYGNSSYKFQTQESDFTTQPTYGKQSTVPNESTKVPSNGSSRDPTSLRGVPREQSLELANPSTIETQNNKTKVYEDTFINTPEVPQSFPELTSLTENQLQRLRDDKAALAAHVDQNNPQVEFLRQLLDQSRESNHIGVERNIQQSSELAGVENELRTLQADLQAKHLLYATKSEALRREYGVTKDDVAKAMRAKQDDLDESSEDMGMKFVDGEVDLPVFMSDYMDARVRYHQMVAKLNLAMKER